MNFVALTLLGSTGSIGCQALDVVAAAKGRIDVVALAAHGSAEALAAQARVVRPRAVALVDERQAVALRRALPAGIALEVGLEAVTALAAEQPADIVLNAITGSVGLRPTLAALDAGRTLALANKESLIVGGDVVLARARPGQIVPVDSEHSGLAQCLRAGSQDEIERLIITASGGPFRGRRAQDLKDVTPAEALRHPTWSMGPMNSLNSATLMNKGLEVIEAHLLFGIPMERIEVVVHPQSLVHALVGFRDGSTVAQVSHPDMRLPIALALGWPERPSESYGRLDLTTAFDLHFEPVDHEAFPLLGLALRAGTIGGIGPAVLNAANEEAAGAFLAGHLRFGEIADVVREVLEDQVFARSFAGREGSPTPGAFGRQGAGVGDQRFDDERSAAALREPLAPTLDLDAVLAAELRAREAAATLIKGLKS